jgi:hypothetical protein
MKGRAWRAQLIDLRAANLSSIVLTRVGPLGAGPSGAVLVGATLSGARHGGPKNSAAAGLVEKL